MNKYELLPFVACQMEINLMLPSKTAIKFEGVKVYTVMAQLGVLEAHHKC